MLSSFMSRYGLPDDVDEAVQVRVDKQHVIHEGHRRIAVVLEESVLRSRISDIEAMAGQLGHLLTATTLPAVSLGIIPFKVERHGLWPQEMFFMFDEAEVTVELVSGHLTVTRPHEIARYAEVFKDLSALAVFGKGARKLITDALAELDG
ncbi:Scr1 family TA system antitoxin-like transcriptional regulator [Nonomuraea sp. NPDC050556]|uniref:Scr1 family TA system antitoxin-like transcriptional regulator n=1 Tax=Nonomuraea sp. NPDC050556 TaxID=3364369 RepID=UPI0037B157FB